MQVQLFGRNRMVIGEGFILVSCRVCCLCIDCGNAVVIGEEVIRN